MRIMKTIAILFTALLMTGISFGQMKYKPKVVVVVLGPKNPTFDESRFPDLHFYYTPELVLKTSKKASKNLNKNAWSAAVGFGRTAGAEGYDSYTGEPTVLVDKSIHSGVTYLIDKNGFIAGKSFNGEREYFTSAMQLMVSFKHFQKKWETESLGNLLKSLIKKGETVKPLKKPAQDIATEFVDFKVADANGTEYDMHSLVKGNSATLVYFIYINSKYKKKYNELE